MPIVNDAYSSATWHKAGGVDTRKKFLHILAQQNHFMKALRVHNGIFFVRSTWVAQFYLTFRIVERE